MWINLGISVHFYTWMHNFDKIFQGKKIWGAQNFSAKKKSAKV